MRSIRYIMGSDPCCFADCKDYMKHSNLEEVKMALKRKEEYIGYEGITSLYAHFTWIFADTIVNYKEHMGAIVHMESPERQNESIQNANRRLARRVFDFQEAGIELKESDDKF